MTRLLSVIRRPQVIVAIVSDRHAPFVPDGSGDVAPYREHVVPLSQLSEAICPWRDKDVRAWRALAKVPSLERRAGMAIVRAIIGSVADPDNVPESVAPIRFKDGPMDLRPHLCAPASEQEILDGLGSVLDEVSAEVDFPPWHWSHRQAIAVLPPAFRRQFLWGLHLSPWRRVELTLAVYEALELDANDGLRLAVARLLSLAERPKGLDWARVLVDVAPEERLSLCENLIERAVYRHAPDDDRRRAVIGREWESVTV